MLVRGLAAQVSSVFPEDNRELKSRDEESKNAGDMKTDVS